MAGPFGSLPWRQVAAAVTGYFRPRPEPTLERALRAAFAELDGQLAAVLGERTCAPVVPAGRAPGSRAA